MKNDGYDELRAVLEHYGIDPSVVDGATIDELIELQRGLKALAQASTGWTLQARQRRAEDALSTMEPGFVYELLYGGAAGGGKSEWLLYHCLRIARTYPKSRCLMLRRTFPELRRSLILRSMEKIKPQAGDRFAVADREWRFGNDSVIEFGYVDSETDVYQYQSAEYACLARHSTVLMADGSDRRIDEVRPGDMVATLEGPRRVLRSEATGDKECVSIDTDRGSVVASLTHRVLSDHGWLSPIALRPIGTMPAACSVSPQGRARRRGSSHADQAPARALARLMSDRAGHPASGGTTTDEQTGSATSADAPQGGPQLRQWTARLVLHELGLRSTEPDVGRGAPPGVLTESTLPGWSACCRPGCGCGDAPVLRGRAGDPGRTPSPGDGVGRSRGWWRSGGRASTRSGSHLELGVLPHPYTTQALDVTVGVHHGLAHMTRVGVLATWDLTVEGANHYLSSNGSIHANCIAFDELTQWPADSTSEDPAPDQSFVYTYLMSRLRVSVDLLEQGLVPHIIAGTNPGGIGGSWVRKRFIDIGAPEVWHDITLPTGKVTRRMFVPAKISDNRYIDRPTYEAALSSLNENTRKALMDGSWDTVEGQYFTEWDREIHVAPVKVEKHWTRLGGYDYGYTAPACFLLAAFDGDDNCYVYREWYDTRHTPPMQAEKIRKMLGKDKVDAVYCDPSIWNTTGAGPPIAQQLIDNGLYALRRASNKRVDGWVRVREFLRVDKNLGKARIVIDPSCTNLIRTLPMLIHSRTNPEDLDTKGEDHACLAAGTLVSTARGDVPIEDVRVGDVVWTSEGYALVGASAMTAERRNLWRVETTVGALVGTADHPVFTTTGKVRLADLTPSDTLAGWTRSSSAAPCRSTKALATTSAASTSSIAGRGYTDACGPTTTAPSRQQCTSTTATATARITRWRTWNWWQLARTSRYTLASGHPRAKRRPAGGCKPAVKATPRSRSSDAPQPLDAAGRTWATLFARAWSAARRSPRDSPLEPSSVQVLARPQPCGEGAVYNLRVLGGPSEFVANGVLVSNCDALRYLLMSRPQRRRAPQTEPTDPEERLAWQIAKKHRRRNRQDDRQFAGM